MGEIGAYLQGLFEAQKGHIDYRFGELKEDIAKLEVCTKEKNTEQNRRLEKLEKRKKLNLAASAGGGIVGGFIAMATKLLWPGGGS